MRRLALLALPILSLPMMSWAQLPAEELTLETMATPGNNWFIAKTGNGGYIWDGESGEMQGMVSLSTRSPAVIPYFPRQEIYAAESYMSRGVHGDRTDIVAVYDFDNLSPIAEVEIPNIMARLGVRNHLGLMNNGRHLAVLNMNPGYSVSIVDVEDRLFIYEVSTPGCAIIMPVADSDFLMVCGDGTLQLIQLDVSGFEQNRERSEVFFNVTDDAVFDRTARTADGWLLITHAGMIFEVSTDDDEIIIGDGWSVLPPDTTGWRPGGRTEFLSVHQDKRLLYVAMHEGPVDTHHEPGTEIWVVNLDTRQRIAQIEIEDGANSLMVTQEDEPILVVGTGEGGTEIYDALTFKHLHSLDTPGAQMFEDF
ncbi:MAG: amine dehydrogenase large subunit [Gammaproteobacteria bacterium]